jgi:hypothetical protein
MKTIRNITNNTWNINNINTIRFVAHSMSPKKWGEED